MQKHTKIVGIYKITNPKGKIYIGQSTDCHVREIAYKNLHCKRQAKIHNSIKKYGWKAHKFEIIHQCNSEQLDSLEVYYIELFQCFNSEHGLNLKTGGKQGRLSKESLIKKGLKTRGRKQSQEHINRRTLARLKANNFNTDNSKFIKEFQNKNGSWNKGKKCPTMSAGKMGSKNPMAKKIINTSTGKIYETVTEASKDINIPIGTLSCYLTGIRTNKTSLHYL